MNKIVKNALILMAITLVSGICLGFVYDITKGPIEQQEALAQEEAYKAVFPDMAAMEPLYDGSDDMNAVKGKAAQVLAENGLEAVHIEGGIQGRGFRTDRTGSGYEFDHNGRIWGRHKFLHGHPERWNREWDRDPDYR